MKMIWNKVNSLNINIDKKIRIFLLTMFLLSGIVGGLLGLFLNAITLIDSKYLVCFIGYPAIFLGLIGGCIYLYNHKF